MSRMIIYLGLLLPTGSSDLPEARGPRYASNLGLASDGVYMCPLCYHRGGSLLHCPSTLTTLSGGIFLLHWPWSHLHRTLSGILPLKPGLSSPPLPGPRSFSLLKNINLIIHQNNFHQQILLQWNLLE